MSHSPQKQVDSFLLRLRKEDSLTGVSPQTLQKLVIHTGLSKTDLVHYALRDLANRSLPSYEQDDGELTTDQLRAIREVSSATNTPEDKFTEGFL